MQSFVIIALDNQGNIVGVYNTMDYNNIESMIENIYDYDHSGVVDSTVTIHTTLDEVASNVTLH